MRFSLWNSVNSKISAIKNAILINFLHFCRRLSTDLICNSFLIWHLLIIIFWPKMKNIIWLFLLLNAIILESILSQKRKILRNWIIKITLIIFYLYLFMLLLFLMPFFILVLLSLRMLYFIQNFIILTFIWMAKFKICRNVISLNFLARWISCGELICKHLRNLIIKIFSLDYFFVQINLVPKWLLILSLNWILEIFRVLESISIF